MNLSLRNLVLRNSKGTPNSGSRGLSKSPSGSRKKPIMCFTRTLKPSVYCVALMLCSIYTTSMSRNSEEPVFNQIEQIRTSLGLSRQELADLVGVHYQTIGYLERGEYSPSLVLALRIAKALNKEVSDLFSLTEQKKGKK